MRERTLAPALAANKPMPPTPFAGLRTVTAHVHTVGFFTECGLPNPVFELFREMGAYFDEPTWWGFTWRVHRCTRHLLAEILQIIEEHNLRTTAPRSASDRDPTIKVSRVDVTFDLAFNSLHHRRLTTYYLRQHLRVRTGARHVRRLDFIEKNGEPNGNFAFVDYHSPERGKSKGTTPARNFEVYKDPRGVQEESVLRVELRFMRVPTIRRYFPVLGEIMDAAPAAILDKHLCLGFVDEKAVRRWHKAKTPLGGKQSRMKPPVGLFNALQRWRPDGQVKKYMKNAPLVLAHSIRHSLSSRSRLAAGVRHRPS